jgi:hypothetical protein
VHRSGHPLLLLAFIALASILTLPAPASAAIEITTTDPTDIVTVGHSCLDGQADDLGTMYRACEGHIERQDVDGNTLPQIVVPLNGIPIRDVAPSPNGDYLYIPRGALPPGRLQRQSDGSYRHDPTFKLEPFLMWNSVWFQPSGWLITTDAAGDLYVSGGSFWSGAALGTAQTSVIKYSPDGKLLAVIGDWGKTDGFFNANQDIEVSRDGTRLYVAENCGVQCNFGVAGYVPSRIQRFDLNANGRYVFTRVLSARTGDCNAAGAVHSGYGMAMDIRGHLFVNSTTCGATIEFNNLDQPVGRVAKARDTIKMEAVRSHWLSVDWRGSLCQVEWNACIKKAIAPALPANLPPYAGPRADVIAPTITFSQIVKGAPTQLLLDAVDERTPVTHLQIKTAAGWGEWKPFAVSMELTGADAAETSILVRVRDAAGNVSSTATATEQAQSPPAPPEEAPLPRNPTPIAPPSTAPAKDTAAPILKSISMQLVGTSRTRAKLKVVATDNKRVTRVRITATGFRASRKWIPFSSTQTLKLKRVPNRGVRVQVQVADAAGNLSKPRTIRLRPR